jgi:anti-anti-sigma factor
MRPPPRGVGTSDNGGFVPSQSCHFGNIAVAVPAGRLDHSSAADFEQGLLPLVENPQVAGLIVDFTSVEYISSMGLRVLMLAAKGMRGRKARVAAVALQPIVAEIFAISRFDSVFEMFPSVREAMAAMSAQALAAYDVASTSDT